MERVLLGVLGVAVLVGAVWLVDMHRRLDRTSADLAQAERELSATEGLVLNNQARIAKVEGRLAAKIDLR